MDVSQSAGSGQGTHGVFERQIGYFLLHVNQIQDLSKMPTCVVEKVIEVGG